MCRAGGREEKTHTNTKTLEALVFSLLTAAKEFSIEQYHAKIDFINDGHTNKADDVRVITIMIASLFLVLCEENSIFHFFFVILTA